MTEETQLTPAEYFEQVKNRRQTITDDVLDNVYDNALHLMRKHMETGQNEAFNRVAFHLECVDLEREAVKVGIDRFVYRKDIEHFIEQVADNVVVIKELRNFPREIPDEIIEQYQKVKDLFHEFYVVFTDYTGEERQKVEKERREKDPILFGAFQSENAQTMVERFYYIGDWIDPYCDLTLDEMVTQVKRMDNETITHSINTPESSEELKKQVLDYKKKQDEYVRLKAEEKPERRPGIFSKVKTFLRRF